MKNPFVYARRITCTVRIGDLFMGSGHPIVLQSMTNTKTEQTDESVEQSLRIAAAGGQIVRLTAQGRTQAHNLEMIRCELSKRGCRVPLCADIHFNPELALIAATAVQKVRINPGNYADEDALQSKFIQLLDVCKVYNTALRIGVNHGSLSARIVEKYGDTPRGMVESAMEFLRICKDEKFENVVVSLKSSNPRVMVESYRLAAETMDSENLNFPLHLGVTEAGEGEDGRIRSAVGIGALLADGIGDTIRVSLTEEPECEIPVAKALAGYFEDRPPQNYIPVTAEPLPYNPLLFTRRTSVRPVVVGFGGDYEMGSDEWYYLTLDDMTIETYAALRADSEQYIVLSSENSNWVGEIRAAIVCLMRAEVKNPIILYKNYESFDNIELYSAADMGAVLIDGLADGVWIECKSVADRVDIGLSILQATRLRLSKTEIISCPGCGRTLFDLQATARAVKARLGDRPGLKIAVMGCIVNGPGEMADADFGYVGAGSGLVTLYRAREVVERNIPQSEALDRLEQIINTVQH